MTFFSQENTALILGHDSYLLCKAVGGAHSILIPSESNLSRLILSDDCKNISYFYCYKKYESFPQPSGSRDVIVKSFRASLIISYSNSYHLRS
jgi:hypothetical protein